MAVVMLLREREGEVRAFSALFPPSVVLLPALLLAPFLLSGLFEVLFSVARVKRSVGARWGGVALWGTLLCLSVAGGSWLYRQGSGIVATLGPWRELFFFPT